MLPRYMYKVRFDLPGSSAPIRTGSDEGNEINNPQENSTGTTRLVISTDRLLQNRIDSLQGFLKERRTRLRAARRRTKISSGLINSADYTIWQSKKGLQRSRDTRCGKLTTGTTSGAKGGVDDHKQEKVKSETITRCEECQKHLKERDKFWGLESDSEEEDIREFNEHVRRRSLRRDSRCFEAAESKVVGVSSGILTNKEVALKRKPARGIAGRGTWVTPAYVPPWTVHEVDRKRANSLQTHPVFGPKKGIDKYLF